MSEPSFEDYKLRLMIYKEWKHKTDPEDAVKKINTLLGNDMIMTSTKVNYQYKRFDKEDTDIFHENSDLHVFSTQHKKSGNLVDSLLMIMEDRDFEREVITNGGRFLFSFYYCHKLKQSFIIVYDLFRGTKRKNPVSFNVFRLTFKIAGEYLLCLEDNRNANNLHVLKINYDDLSVGEWKTASIDVSYNFVSILSDQLDDKKFAMCDWNKFISGQIQNDGVVLISSQNFGDFYGTHSRRLIGNELQGFKYRHTFSVPSTFCKLNLNTMEMEKTNAVFSLNNDELMNKEVKPDEYCWANDHCYNMFRVGNQQYHLLMFDSKTLIWSNVQISTNSLLNMFVDENDVLTFYVGVSWVPHVYYRLALRKPDTLKNLTWLSALKESNLYGNNKCINVARKLQI